MEDLFKFMTIFGLLAMVVWAIDRFLNAIGPRVPDAPDAEQSQYVRDYDRFIRRSHALLTWAGVICLAIGGIGWAILSLL